MSSAALRMCVHRCQAFQACAVRMQAANFWIVFFADQPVWSDVEVCMCDFIEPASTACSRMLLIVTQSIILCLCILA